MPQPGRPTELRQALGPLDTICIVVGAIVGVGIFFMPKGVAALAGSSSMAMLAWAIGGVIALLGALTFAELGGQYPRTGGQYEILRDSYGPLAAFMYVFCNATAIQAGAIAIIAIICTKNLDTAFDLGLSGNLEVGVVSAAIIVSLMISNAIGVVWGSRVQNITVFAKVATLLSVVALAVFHRGDAGSAEVAGASQTVRATSVSMVFAALVPTLFAFGGWQHALWIGGEVKDPRRNVPRAIVIGVGLVVLIYLSANWAYLDLLGHARVASSQALAADAVATVWPRAGGRLIAAAVAFSAYGVLNAQLLSGPRLLYAMARDGRFFRPFTMVSGRFQTPIAAIGLLGALALALLAAAGEKGVDALCNGVVCIDSVFFVLTGAAVFVLRKRRPNNDRPVKVPLYPIVPALFVLLETAVIYGSFQEPKVLASAKIGIAWIAAAALCYFIFFRDRRPVESR